MPNGCGLDITENEFLSLKSNERDVIMFKNIVEIRKQMNDYKFHKKIHYWWLSALTAVVGTLLGIKFI